MTNLDNLSLQELKELLRSIKNYKSITSQVWKRWRKIFANNLDNKKDLIIEYSFWLDKDSILQTWINVYKNTFNLNTVSNDILLRENNELVWWIRVFCWDDMVDMSFKKILQTI